jgi:DNA-directed RNA polymerase subunit RPC12/RpoP
MIKIIDIGPHQSVVKEVVCSNCGATLQYTPADVKENTYTDYGGGSDTYHEIQCINCSHTIRLNRY